MKQADRVGPRLQRAVALAALGFLGLLAALRATAASPAGTARGAALPSAPSKTYGAKSAPITVEAFTDYQCPGCRLLFEQALRPMIEDYVASGKVYLIHHDFPLRMHPYSGQAARWANAAAEVGDFGAAEAALFDNQGAWGASGDIAPFIAHVLSASDFARVKTILKGCTTPAPQATTADADPLAKSGNVCAVDPYIAEDIKLGNHLPVSVTPTYTIYLRGKKVVSSSSIVSWPILKQFLDSLLNS